MCRVLFVFYRSMRRGRSLHAGDEDEPQTFFFFLSHPLHYFNSAHAAETFRRLAKSLPLRSGLRPSFTT